MAKYIAHIVERVERVFELEAETPEEAALLAHAKLHKYAEWDLRSIESDNGLTIIDAETGKPVLHDELTDDA